ncbi:MAG: hypothetical protein IPM48_14860 [Saprospiraceae bacterium]|nr:hypothetical protein [Saprospiraceae bacterium]
MAYFNIDFNQFRSSARKDEPRISPSQQVQTNQQNFISSFQQPTEAQLKIPKLNLSNQPQFSSGGIQQQPAQKTSLVWKIADILDKPQQMFQNLITGGKGYEQVLKENPEVRKGVSTAVVNTLGPLGALLQEPFEKKLETSEFTRKATAFGGELVLDPLNVAGGFIPKLFSKANKAVKATKTFDTVADVTKPVRELIGSKFVRGYGLPETYNVLKSEIPTKLGVGAEKIVKDIADVFSKYGGLSDEARDAVAKFLEPKFAGAGEDLGAVKKALQESGEWEKIQPMLRESRRVLNREVYDLVERGRMTGEVAKDLLTRGGYFPHTDFAPKTIQKYFGKGREIGERAWYLKKRKGGTGFTFNAPKAIAKRELAQFQNAVMQDFLKMVKSDLGYKIRKAAPAKEGFIAFLDNTPKTLIELKGWALPERVAKDLLAVYGESGLIARSIDTFNRLWKPTATAINPSFHTMNIMGNIFNSWIGGMKDPRKFLQAIGGGFDEGEKAILESSGILARGQFGADIVNKAFADVDAGRLLAQFDSPIVRNLKKYSPRQIGNFFENNARSAFFLNSREKFITQGLDELTATRKAIAETNKYLFDYLAGLAPFETNIMRRVFPFYTWARFNIPLQLQSIVTAPQRYAPLAKLYKTMNEGYNIPENEEGFGFPTPFTDANGDPIRWVPNLPVNDIFSLNLKRVGNMLNPAIKDLPQIPAMIYPGFTPFDTYTGAPRTDRDLPAGEQFRDLFDPTRKSSFAQSLLRPVRSTTQFGDVNRRTESVLDLIIGGFYVNNAERAELRKIYDEYGRNAAINVKIKRLQSEIQDPERLRKETQRLLKLME